MRCITLILFIILFQITSLNIVNAGFLSELAKTTLKNKIKKSIIKFGIEKKEILNEATALGLEVIGHSGQTLLKYPVKRKIREKFHTRLCEEEGYFIAVIRFDDTPIFEQPDNNSKVLGKYELNEQVCIQKIRSAQEVLNKRVAQTTADFALTSFGWIGAKHFRTDSTSSQHR